MSQYRKFEIPIVYILVGIIWVIFSDMGIKTLSKNPEVLSILQTYKGWAFVLVTGLLLFLLLRKEHNEHARMRKRIAQLEDENRKLQQKLHTAQGKPNT